MPIDHTCVRVAKDAHKKAVDFYVAALKPLGYEKVMDFGEAVGFGVRPGHGSDFWVSAADGNVPPTHFAFAADGEPNQTARP